MPREHVRNGNDGKHRAGYAHKDGQYHPDDPLKRFIPVQQMDGEPYVAAYGKRRHNDLPEPYDGALVPQKDEKEQEHSQDKEIRSDIDVNISGGAVKVINTSCEKTIRIIISRKSGRLPRFVKKFNVNVTFFILC